MPAGQRKMSSAYIQEIQDLQGDEENKDRKAASSLDFWETAPNTFSSLRPEEGALPFIGCQALPQQILQCKEIKRPEHKHDASLEQKVCRYFPNTLENHPKFILSVIAESIWSPFLGKT